MTSKKQRNMLRRKGEKYIRMAYDLEADIRALRAIEQEALAAAVQVVANHLRKIGQALLREGDGS